MSAALVRVRSVPSRRATANIVTLGVLAACLTFVTIATPYRNGPPIRSDGLGYHIWTRTILNWEPSICDWTPGYVKNTPDEILEASAQDLERAEKFVRLGSSDALSLRASNGKFVSAALDSDGRALPLRAIASEPGPGERFALEIKP